MPNSLLESEKYQSLIKQLKIPSLQQSIFVEECNREIVFIRDDLIHPVISGNKWRKLKHHINYFSENSFMGIVSMGGTYSNHLHALAFVCNQLDVPCSLFIYGWNGILNSPTLRDIQKGNAVLLPVTRQQAAIFRNEGIGTLDDMYQDYYWIPEGGGGFFGELGMKELIEELPIDFDEHNHVIVCASGTGTSIQGILDNTTKCQVATMQSVKMANYPWAGNERIHMIHSNEHHSFANRAPKLMDFLNYFEYQYGILLDPVYTAPLMFSFLQSEEWKSYDKIYFIHTGGLQANRIK